MPGLAAQTQKGIAEQQEHDDINRLPPVEEPRVCASATGFTSFLGNASCSSAEATPAAIRPETKVQESLDGHGHMQYLTATKMQGQIVLSRKTTKQKGKSAETFMLESFGDFKVALTRIEKSSA